MTSSWPPGLDLVLSDGMASTSSTEWSTLGHCRCRSPTPVMVPGTASPETVIWAARHRYPYVVLGSSLEQTKELIAIYRETARGRATR